MSPQQPRAPVASQVDPSQPALIPLLVEGGISCGWRCPGWLRTSCSSCSSPWKSLYCSSELARPTLIAGLSCPAAAPDPGWFDPCIHPAWKATCLKASGMEIARSNVNAQLHPVLKASLKKNSSEHLQLSCFHSCAFLHLSEPFVFHLYNREKKKKNVIHTLTESEWAFFSTLWTVFFPSLLQHFTSSALHLSLAVNTLSHAQTLQMYWGSRSAAEKPTATLRSHSLGWEST